MSVEVYVDGFDGRPVPTNSVVTGRVRVKLKKPEQAKTVTQVLFAFYGRSSVHITRHELRTYTKYSSHNRFEFENDSSRFQPRAVGPRSEWVTKFYESQCLLFAHRHVLLQSDFQMPAAGGDCALDFPFEIRVPTHSEPQPPDSIEGHQCQSFAASGCFTGSLRYYPPGKIPPPQPLPDSIYSFEGDFIENTKGAGSIRYTMHAIVPELTGGGGWIFGHRGPPESTVDIPLYNPVSIPPRPMQYKTLGHQDTIRSVRLLHSNQAKRLSLRDNMRSIFKKDRLPWIALGVVFQGPELLWVDQAAETRLPFSIGIRRLAGGIGEATGPPPMALPGVRCDKKGRPLDPAAAAAADDYTRNNLSHVPTPRVFLKSLKLKLVAHTALRGGYDRFSGFGPKRFEGITPVTFFKFKASNSSNSSSSSLPLELPVGDNAWTDLGLVLGVSLGDLRSAGGGSGIGGITGEFLTPNFWRRWGVEWEMTLGCAEEEIYWKSETNYGGGLGIQFLRGDGTFAGQPPPPSPAYAPAADVTEK